MRILDTKSKWAALAIAPLLGIIIAVAIAAFTEQAVARPPSGGGSAGNSSIEFAVGGITTYDGHVAFAAHHNFSNGKYTGHVVQDSFGVSRSGPVDCVSTSGQHATILWHVTQSDNSGEIGEYRLFEMCDFGEPTNGIPPDTFFDWGNSNTDCNSNQQCGYNIIHGNIVVKGPF